MNHQCDRDMIGAADSVEMVLDVADDKADLIEVVAVIPVSEASMAAVQRRFMTISDVYGVLILPAQCDASLSRYVGPCMVAAGAGNVHAIFAAGQ